MSIRQTNTIDIVAVRPDSSVVRLVIADDLDWDDLDAHAQLLQDKVNTYLAFVETGQLAEMSDIAVPENPVICIELAMLHAPSAAAEHLLGHLRDSLAAVNVVFEANVDDDQTN